MAFYTVEVVATFEVECDNGGEAHSIVSHMIQAEAEHMDVAVLVLSTRVINEEVSRA